MFDNAANPFHFNSLFLAKWPGEFRHFWCFLCISAVMRVISGFGSIGSGGGRLETNYLFSHLLLSALISPTEKKMKTRIKHCRSSSVVVCPLNFLIASWNACGNLPLLTVVDLNFCYRIFHFSISTVRIVSGSQFLQTPFIAHFMVCFWNDVQIPCYNYKYTHALFCLHSCSFICCKCKTAAE